MKLTIVNGSPREGSSTEILAERFRLGFVSLKPETDCSVIRLNDLDIIPCQACGINPSPLPCIYKDGIYPLLAQLHRTDMLLVASPVYFDSVSAQTKLFIDRTNCLRPPLFDGDSVSFDTSHLPGGRGAYILVGGERERFDAAERVIGGMFVWCGIEKVGRMLYAHSHSRLGSAARDREALASAFNLGVSAAESFDIPA